MVEDKPVSYCQQQCEQDNTCLSIVYRLSNSDCYMKTVVSENIVLDGWSGYEYYEIHCSQGRGLLLFMFIEYTK